MEPNWIPRSLRLGGVFVGVAAAAPVFVRVAGEGSWLTRDLLVWTILLGTFLGLFWLQSGTACSSYGKRLRVTLLALSTSIGLALVALGSSGLSGVFPVLAVTLVAAGTAPPNARRWAVAQSIALLPAFLIAGFSRVDAVLLTVVFGAFQGFVLFTTRVAVNEREARRVLEVTNRELRRARSLLEARARDAERVDIARELHDVMGHHLSALSLTLEAAACGPLAAVTEHVAEAQILTKRLLRDVRRVVSVLRSEPTESLEEGLNRLAQEVRSPRIHLALDRGAASVAPASSQVLLRCAQEVVTNAVRHSGADNLWLVVKGNGERLVLEARDDGKGSDTTVPGHGFVGMGERLHALGGDFSWKGRPGSGFTISLWVPTAGKATG